MLSWRPRSGAPGKTSSGTLFNEEVQRKLEVLSIVARKLQVGRTRAERKTRKGGSGIEFADHRAYSAGDDFRFLDWKVFGRSDRLLLKQFEEEEDITVHILLDCSASMSLGSPPKLDYARQVAAALGYIGLASLDRVGLQTYAEKLGVRMAPSRGKARALRMLRFLEGLGTSGGTATADVMRKFAARESRRGIAVVISDAYDDEGFRQGINTLRYAKFEPVVLQIHDPEEAAPRLEGDLSLVDVESGQVRDVTITPGLLERFEEAHAAHMQGIEDFCRDKQVPHFALSTATPFDEAVLKVLRRGGIVF